MANPRRKSLRLSHLQMGTQFPGRETGVRLAHPTSVDLRTGRVPECLDSYQTPPRQYLA